jgi:hypothetical protein
MSYTIDKSNRLPKEQAKFLMTEDEMKGKYLGACLDSCRWGSQTTVMYEMGVKGLIGFIQNWMQQNPENFTDLWHEKQIEELYTKFELPFIHHETCPRDKNHSGVVRDLGGKLRCAHKSEERLKPNFVRYWDSFDKLSGMTYRHYFQDEPSDPLPDDAWDEKTGELLPEYKEDAERYQKELEEFQQEEPSLLVTDVCYSILSDRGRILPLETIIKRLNLRPEIETVYCDRFGPCERVDELSQSEKEHYEIYGWCQGHVQEHDKVEFPFDGWDLAFYVQKWYQQLSDGKSPIFEK